jgi:streptogramin lyase
MTPRSWIGVAVLGLLGLILVPAGAAAAPFVDGTFPVSSLGRNNRIVEGPDGNMWVTLGVLGKDVARIDPSSGEVKEFELGITSHTGITAAFGKLWVTGEGHLASFDPSDPVGTETTVEISDITGFKSITAGPDGNLWVAASDGLIKVPPGNPADAVTVQLLGLSPRDIDVAGQQIVIADSGGDRILAATPAAAERGEFDEYKSIQDPFGVAGLPSGQIAFSVADGFGFLTPPEPPQLISAPGTEPIGVAVGPDGAFWTAESLVTASVARFGPGVEPLTVAPGFATRPRQIGAGPENTLWVTLESTGPATLPAVGRISGVVPPTSPPVAKEPRTQIKRGPKGRLKTTARRALASFRFFSPDSGAGFECHLAGPSPKASKAARFRTCMSAKTYRLRPGRYRFEVRAVLAGVADKSPARRGFRVVRVASTKR